MTQRIHDRLNDGLDNELLVKALRTGKYTDQFTTDRATPEETQATLDRLPKFMRKKEDE
ncbi:hypothetical protein LCGC14_1426310 [marine sediment metagenome]|uniref:Uncharacterized protein n=1 Tax=marine sediment metagenome TaxID=412755 RepID=A0A0F9MRL4_9ZZZZ